MNLEQVRQLVLDGRLIAEPAIDAQIVEFQTQALNADDGDALIDWLAGKQLLTEWHALTLRAGVAGPYVIGPYRIFDRLATGRLGSVFRAVHEGFNQPVSLKVFPAGQADDADRAERLASETRVAIQVDSPHVVRTFQVGRVGPVTFVAFEALRGETLATRLANDRRLPLFEACHLGREIALGLAHLHSLDIVHRDLQPANIWVTADGHAKLMEFGAARDALSYLDSRGSQNLPIALQSSELLGNCDYISPDQALNEQNAGPRTDIYSMGGVLFQCLTGELPFPDPNPVRKMLQKAGETARRVTDVDPEIPEPIADIVATMLARDPKDRYQRAEDAAWALEQHLAQKEWEIAATADINPDFLEWAHSTKELETPVAAADSGLIGFLDWMAEHEEEEQKEMGFDYGRH